MQELADQPEDHASASTDSDADPGRTHPRKRLDLVLAAIVVVALVVGAVLLVARAQSLDRQASRVEARADELTAAKGRVDRAAQRDDADASHIERVHERVVPAVTASAASQDALIDSANLAVDASDAAIELFDAGDVAAGMQAFRTRVTAAVDANEAALRTARTDLDAARAAVTALDEALRATP